MIKVADKARIEAAKLMKHDGYDPSVDFIRVGVKSGGCSGLSYELKFDKVSSESDKIFEDNGIKIAMEKVLYSLTQMQAERVVVAKVSHYKKIWHIPKKN